MKKSLGYFFSFLFIIIVFTTIFIVTIDKKKVINSFKSQISKNIGYTDLDFNNDISISILPYPCIKFNNVVLSNKTNNYSYTIKTEELNLISNWSSILKKKPKILELSFLNSKIIFTRQGLVNIKKENIRLEKIVNNYVHSETNYFEGIKRIYFEEGEFLFRSENKNFLIKDINFIYYQNKTKLIQGSAYLNKLSSKIDYLVKSKDFKNYDILIKQQLNLNKELIEWKLNLTNGKNIKLFGNIFGNSIDIEKIDFSSPFNFDKGELRRYFVNSSFQNKLDVNLSFLFKKLKYKDFLLKDLNFLIRGNENLLKVKNLKSKLNESDFFLEAYVDISNLKLKGFGSVKNYEIPISLYGKTKFDLHGGKTKLDFDFSKKNLNFGKKFFDDLFFKAKLNVEKPILVGIDLNQAFSRIKNISDISSLFNVLEIKNLNGTSKLIFIRSDFELSSKKLKISNLQVKDTNIKLNGSGTFDLNKNFLKMENFLFITDKQFSKLPSIPIKINGPLNKLSYKYDIENFKNVLISKGLNLILRKNQKIIIDPAQIIDDFNKNDNDELKNILQELFR